MYAKICDRFKVPVYFMSIFFRKKRSVQDLNEIQNESVAKQIRMQICSLKKSCGFRGYLFPSDNNPNRVKVSAVEIDIS